MTKFDDWHADLDNFGNRVEGVTKKEATSYMIVYIVAIVVTLVVLLVAGYYGLVCGSC